MNNFIDRFRIAFNTVIRRRISERSSMRYSTRSELNINYTFDGIFSSFFPFPKIKLVRIPTNFSFTNTYNNKRGKVDEIFES